MVVVVVEGGADYETQISVILVVVVVIPIAVGFAVDIVVAATVFVVMVYAVMKMIDVAHVLVHVPAHGIGESGIVVIQIVVN